MRPAPVLTALPTLAPQDPVPQALVTGTAGNDVLNGGAASDTIQGLAGNDLIYGGDSDDVLAGDDGNDILFGDNGNDSLRGGYGRDALFGGPGNDDLNGGNMGGSDSLWGGAGIDTATYTGADAAVVLSLGNGGAGNTDVFFDIENLKGSALGDDLSGDGAANRLDGGGGNDGIDGGDGDDTLVGGTGNDTLTGGGADVFRFSSALNGGSNVDRIADFATSDALQLENSVFTVLGATGALSSAHFRANFGAFAVDGDDFVLYDVDSGNLYFDADGSGAGTAILVATLIGEPVLGAGDIFVT